MNLTSTGPISEREWMLAWDIVTVQAHGGRLSLREQCLDDICGSPARALRVLATVRRYRNACVDLDQRHAVSGHHHRSVPRPTGSSAATRPARRTATARAGRSDLAAHLALLSTTLGFAAYVLWQVAR